MIVIIVFVNRYVSEMFCASMDNYFWKADSYNMHVHDEEVIDLIGELILECTDERFHSRDKLIVIFERPHSYISKNHVPDKMVTSARAFALSAFLFI